MQPHEDTLKAKFMELIEEQLIRHEGLRLKPLRFTSVILALDIGCNLVDCGIFQTEV